MGVILWLGLVLACGGGRNAEAPQAVAPAPEPAPAAAAAAPALAPFPYTAEQIGAAWRPGLVVTWQVTGEGKVEHQRWEVRAADGERIEVAYFDATEDGSPVGEAETSWSSWAELRDHASFPAERTTVDEVALDTPFGTFDTLRYTVTGGPADPAGMVKRFWFGKDTPGAPLLHVVEVDGQPVMELKMLSRAVPGTRN